MKQILTFIVLMAFASTTNAQFGAKVDSSATINGTKPTSVTVVASTTIGDTTANQQPVVNKPKVRAATTACDCEKPRTVATCELPMTTGICDLKHLIAKMTSPAPADTLYRHRFLSFVNQKFGFQFTLPGDAVNFLTGVYGKVDYIFATLPKGAYDISYLDCNGSVSWKELPGNKEYAVFTFKDTVFLRGGVDETGCGNFIRPAVQLGTGSPFLPGFNNSPGQSQNQNQQIIVGDGLTGQFGNVLSRMLFGKNLADLSGAESAWWLVAMAVAIMLFIGFVTLCIRSIVRAARK